MLLRTCEFVDNRHTADPEQMLADFADTISRTGAAIFRHHSAGVVFCPEHAHLLAAAGMSRPTSGPGSSSGAGSRADLGRVGKDGVGDNDVRYADGTTDPDIFDRLFATDGPKALPIVVAGARNAGISMVVRVFSGWSASSVPVLGRTPSPTHSGAQQ